MDIAHRLEMTRQALRDCAFESFDELEATEDSITDFTSQITSDASIENDERAHAKDQLAALWIQVRGGTVKLPGDPPDPG